MYYRYGGGGGVILCLYVDDILIFGSSLKVIEEVKEFLSNNFEMKDLGETDVCNTPSVMSLFGTAI